MDTTVKDDILTANYYTPHIGKTTQSISNVYTKNKIHVNDTENDEHSSKI